MNALPMSTIMKTAYATARANGWYDESEDSHPDTIFARIVEEAAEFIQADRCRVLVGLQNNDSKMAGGGARGAELADIVLLIASYIAHVGAQECFENDYGKTIIVHNIHLGAPPLRRTTESVLQRSLRVYETPQRWLRYVCREAEEFAKIEKPRSSAYYHLGNIVLYAQIAAEALGIDLEREITAKNAVNQTRGYRHGGKSY